VRSLKAHNHVVAMTGDGVNDAPALKIADIGVAMGNSGTEVAKEAASMVLTDDNFATIVRAVEEGRAIYDNIVKFVRFQLSTNLGAIFTVLSALLLGLPEPFNPIQILWINIIMDGPPAMSLGVDTVARGIMERPPREPGERILRLRRLFRLVLFGLIMTAGSLGVMVWALRQEPGAVGRAATLAFTTFVLFQLFNAFNARAEYRSTFGPNFFQNAPLWLSIASAAVLQVLALHWGPTQAVFGTVALSASDWGVTIAVASSILVLEEAWKLGKQVKVMIWGERRGRPRNLHGAY
jgi:Ca2+-transporting ATPase